MVVGDLYTFGSDDDLLAAILTYSQTVKNPQNPKLTNNKKTQNKPKIKQTNKTNKQNTDGTHGSALSGFVC